MGVCRICQGWANTFLGGGWACNALRGHALVMGVRGARRGGKSRPSPPPPFEKRKFFGYIVTLFATFFSFWRPFHHVGTFLLLFTSWWRPFLGLPPPPLRKFLQASMIARRVREHAPRKFFSEFWTCFVTILS